MHAFAFICLAAAAPHAWGLLDARARRRGREAGKNRRLSDELFPELVKLVASDAAAVDYFGSSVAIDGGTVVVGATGAGTGGAVYVLRTTDGGATYDQVAKLTAADGAASDTFGGSVAIDGVTIVVGACCDDDGGSNSGSAYVFEDESGWWDYFSSDSSTRRLPSATILTAAAAVLAAILA